MKKIMPIKSVVLHHKKKVDKHSSGDRRLTGEGVCYHKGPKVQTKTTQL